MSVHKIMRDVFSGKYRGWSVNYDPPPIPVRDFDWSATHPDYDADWRGEEDGWCDNGLKANAATYEELCAEIDAIEDEMAGVNACPDCGERYKGESYFCPPCATAYLDAGHAPHDVKAGRV